MKLLIFFCFFFLAAVSVRGQSDHLLYLYDGQGSTGSWVSINNYVENLQSAAFNDLASSTCVVRGIWLFYDNLSYNSLFLGSSAYYWGENYCTNLPPSLNNLLSSVRFAGPVNDFKGDSVNLYQVEWFQSYEDFVQTDNTNALGFAGSLIVTGRNAWTLYDSPNFTGYHVCVSPADLTFAYPGFYPQASDFGFAGRVVRSVRKGCWTKDIMKPREMSKPGEFHVRDRQETI